MLSHFVSTSCWSFFYINYHVLAALEDQVMFLHLLIKLFTARLFHSVWCTLHGSVFNLILLLLLACHSKAVFSDPGQYLFILKVHKS